MKYVGFLKEEDKNIRYSKHLSEMLLPQSNENLDKKKLINYLKNGSFLAGAMSYIYDNDGYPIGNLDYFTDGEFVWPSYYAYYLEKYDNFFVDKDLLNKSLNQYKTNLIDQKKLQELENEFITEWSGKNS